VARKQSQQAPQVERRGQNASLEKSDNAIGPLLSSSQALVGPEIETPCRNFMGAAQHENTGMQHIRKQIKQQEEPILEQL